MSNSYKPKAYEPNHSYLKTRVIDHARDYIKYNSKVFNKIDLNPSYRDSATCEVLYTIPKDSKVVKVQFNMSDYTFEGITSNIEAEDQIEIYGKFLGKSIVDHVVNKMFEADVLGVDNEEE